MNPRRILVSGVIVAATAATVIANLAQPAAAGGLSRDEAALVAGIGGLIIGATIAQSGPSFHHHHPTYDVSYDGSSAACVIVDCPHFRRKKRRCKLKKRRCKLMSACPAPDTFGSCHETRRPPHLRAAVCGRRDPVRSRLL